MSDRRSLIFAHQEWIGFVQPVGLVVSPTVMVDAQILPDRNIIGRQREFLTLLESGYAAEQRILDFRRLFLEWLDWEGDDLIDAAEHKERLEIALPELGVVLSPTWAVPKDDGWTMIVRVEEGDLDKPPDDAWNASRHARFERLLRETGVPIGLLCNDKRLRLIYAPSGESSGHITFEFSEMASTAGRPILAAFDMLLNASALFTGPEEARLPALLAKSREVQAEVSTKLSRQVLAALYELLRGFVAADVRAVGEFPALARERPEHVYGGLITALMRLVFILYAEDRSLMPDHRVYQQHYSLGGLFTRLRDDAAAWPDTMDQRFGAWPQLLSLFRLIHSGGAHDAALSFVARKGALFDPSRFPFLEQLSNGTPMVPDQTVWNVLRNLMMLDGERLSYRTLDVEQIGSVYEAIMGFRVETTAGRSIAVRAKQRTGAAVIVDLDHLLSLGAGERAKTVQECTNQKLTAAEARVLREAAQPEDIEAALERKVDRDATPHITPALTPVLQPTDERRRSGSHYTPRALTQPIVSEALRPVFERLGPHATPEEILELKVLDPAMGSGAFLVEACRQLSARLVEAWNVHSGPPENLLPDEDELLQARRMVAQRCIYGVDKNPMAVDLAKLSLWLATLAANHEFTFLDHALRHGEFLVGLTMDQIAQVNWRDGGSRHMALEFVGERIHRAMVERDRIRLAEEDLGEEELRRRLVRADEHLENIRLVGDAVVAAFFAGGKNPERTAARSKLLEVLELSETGWQEKLRPSIAATRESENVYPFHFEIEFPEVFGVENPGFDVVAGNPPFLGGKSISTILGDKYRDWLASLHTESNRNADLVAHFFRCAFDLLREDGTFGLIATNTIAQGDTRSTGLRWICNNGGTIYGARCRLKWPGEAAVVVSVVHISKGGYEGLRGLDGREVDTISAFLFHQGGHDDPARLESNANKSFVGMYLRGMGFTFEGTDNTGVAAPLAEMQRLIVADPRNREAIFPYIGGKEINTSPTQAHHRYAIDFQDWPLRRATLDGSWKEADDDMRQEYRRAGIVPLDYPEPVATDWPDLLSIVEGRVRPVREKLGESIIDRVHKKRWWLYANDRPQLRAAIDGMDQILGISRVGEHAAFTLIPARMIFSDSLIIFPFDTYAAFCALQSRPHEIWARFFGSSMKDDLRYTPSDCFETFPFPDGWEARSDLEAVGREYYEFRAALMIGNDEGMTKTYNRFHDPDERRPEIAELRRLHAAMDRAVLDAYEWRDVPTDCKFLLDYEIDEEERGNKKKPWRYRWPDRVRDEVLARLLALNAQRAEEEFLFEREPDSD